MQKQQNIQQENDLIKCTMVWVLMREQNTVKQVQASPCDYHIVSEFDILSQTQTMNCDEGAPPDLQDWDMSP